MLPEIPQDIVDRLPHGIREKSFDGSSIRGFSVVSESDLRLDIDWGTFRWLPSDIFGPGKVTTGAADDIRRATGLARRMVTEFGFSEKLGPLRYAENEEEVFLGHSVTQRKNVSEATAKVIDEEIRRIIDEGEQTAREILSSRMDELHALAKGLLEYETLAADEIRRIIRGERIVRETSTGPVTEEPRPGRRSSVPPAGRPTGLEPEPQPGG